MIVSFSDVSKLVNDPKTMDSALPNILRDYNTENLVFAPDPEDAKNNVREPTRYHEKHQPDSARTNQADDALLKRSLAPHRLCRLLSRLTAR